MLKSTTHWQPLINGYSDHIPQDFRDNGRAAGDVSRRASRSASSAGRRALRVFHLDLYDTRHRAST